jgi:dinuclear metal center YbgI/SA1388 family protein
VKIKEVIDALERFAPLPLQEGYDNAGLQVGLTETEVSGALLCLDVTESIVDEALEKRCNLIVSHHPLLFHAIKTLSDINYVQRTVMKAIENHVTVVSMHTNLDNAQGGVNFKMAEKIGLEYVRFFDEKIVDDITSGNGVIGVLPTEMDSMAFIDKVKKVFGVECAQCNQLLHRKISKVALCGGAGSFLLDDAIKAGADAFITGEMHYHDFFGHEQEIQIAVLGHYQTEQFTNEILYSILREAFPLLSLYMTEKNTNPIKYL